MNINNVSRNNEAGGRPPISIVLKPAVLAVTDWNRAPRILSGAERSAGVSPKINNSASPPKINAPLVQSATLELSVRRLGPRASRFPRVSIFLQISTITGCPIPPKKMSAMTVTMTNGLVRRPIRLSE
jgi:hypothetical protein